MFLVVDFYVVGADSNAVIANKNEFVADIAVLSVCKYTFDSYYKPQRDATYQENQAYLRVLKSWKMFNAFFLNNRFLKAVNFYLNPV